MPSLRDQIAKFSDPKPIDFDPEDFERFDPEIDNEQSIDDKLAKEHYLKNGKSKLRDDGIVLDSKKYGGSRISRKRLVEEEQEEESGDDESISEKESISEDENSEDESSEGDLEDEDSEENLEDTSEEEDDISESDDNSSSGELSDNQNSTNDHETEIRNKFSNLLKKEQKNLISQLAESAQQDAIKGEAVQHQMNIYERILDARIQIQKPLVAANTLPLNNKDHGSLFTDSTEDLMTKANRSVYKLLNNISDLRLKLMKNDGVLNDDQECKISHKRKYDSALENVNKLDSHLAGYRDRVLNKWSRKVQASSGSSSLQSSKFKAFNQTSDAQVKSVLADMERLVKRTKLNRSNYKRLGTEETSDEQSQANNEDSHIFDDTDFYQMLLRDLVDKRMADSQISMGMKWTVGKTKMKKNIDTRASKGRKLRYHVQEKIQGFDAPHNVLTWTDEQADDLFGSLLGQRLQVNEEEPQSEEEPEIETEGLTIFG